MPSEYMWDVEISDANGNLLNNDHLDLLDYLLAELKSETLILSSLPDKLR